ncbi:MAG: hypothetical protein HN368_05005 [Spirochaetales bacterium]|nr:hypothetical protein [Spirochaetales bacterium]
MSHSKFHMVLVIGQNSVWQNTYQLPKLQMGKVNRASCVYRSAAGKGTNLARGLIQLGLECRLLAYAGGALGEKFADAVADDGIPSTIIRIETETRMCTTLVPDGGEATELVEPAPAVNRLEREEFRLSFDHYLQDAGLLTIAGTAMTGEPDSCYLEQVNQAKKAGIPVFLDSYRSHGKAALRAAPEVLKINAEELADLPGRETNSSSKRAEACKQIRDSYRVKWLIITLGRNGAEAFAAERGLACAAPSVTAINPIGSGDVFSAGVVASIADNQNFDDISALARALELGTAMGTANCLNIKTGHVEMTDLESVRKLIEVKELSL